MNKEAIEVDFNNAEADGAIRLHLPVTVESLKRNNIELSEGQKILITDGEMEAAAIASLRDGVWVAVLDENSVKQINN